MAIAFVTNYNGSSTTSGTTLTITGVTANVGDFLFVSIASDNLTATTPTITAVSDGSANVYDLSNAFTWLAAPALVAGGVITGGVPCLVTVALSAATITVTFSAAITVKVAQVHRFTGVSSSKQLLKGANGATTTATLRSVTTSPAKVDAGDLCIGVCGAEYGTGLTATFDSDTTAGSWDAGVEVSVGTASSGISTLVQYKITTDAGVQSYDLTGMTTCRSSAMIMAFRGTPATRVERTAGLSTAVQRAATR